LPNFSIDVLLKVVFLILSKMLALLQFLKFEVYTAKLQTYFYSPHIIQSF